MDTVVTTAKLQNNLLPDPFKKLPVYWEGAVHEHFSDQSRLVPDKIALVDNNNSWTYRELEARSNQLAHCLAAAGIKSQDVVAVYACRSAELVLALLGILKAKAAFVILDPSYPSSRLEKCLYLSQAKALIHLEPAGPLPELLAAQVEKQRLLCYLDIPASSEALAGSPLGLYPQDAPGGTVGADDLAYVAFTSGTTGVPKGILGGHRALSHFFRWHIKKFNLLPADRFSMLSGLAHDPLLRDIFTPLWLGATLFIPSQEMTQTPGYLEEWLARHQISVAHMTPPLASLITGPTSSAESGGSGLLSSLHYIFFGGDILTPRMVERLRSFAPNLTCVNFYGATETPQAMGYFVVDENYRKQNNGSVPLDRVPLGKGIDDVQLLVLKPDGQLAAPGETGEIYVRTPYLTKGYLGEATLTGEKYITNPFTGLGDDRMYRTGDLGYYLPDGNIVFAGRSDTQVKIRGYRVELKEIEATLLEHAGVQECIVTAYEEHAGNQRLVAYLVFKPGHNPSVSELRGFVEDNLPGYMVPATFMSLAALPLTPNGKINHKALPQPPAIKTGAARATPRNEIEKRLVEIWEDLLEVSPVGVTDDFFALGGDSLLSMRMLARIGSIFEKKLPVTILFQNPTIAQLAAQIKLNSADSESSLVTLQPHGTARPLFLIHNANGNLLNYNDLVRELGPEQPVYGIKARGIDGNALPPSTIQEMAAYYVGLIKTVQPEGPYQLLGHSMGGLIVYEMACQLNAAGNGVNFLGLIDTYPPFTSQVKYRPPFIHNHFLQNQFFTLLDLVKRNRNVVAGAGTEINFDPEHLWNLEQGERVDYLFQRLRALDRLFSKSAGKGLPALRHPALPGFAAVTERVTFKVSQSEKAGEALLAGVKDSAGAAGQPAATAPQDYSAPVSYLRRLKGKLLSTFRPSAVRDFIWVKFPWLGYYIVDQKTIYLNRQLRRIEKHLPELKIVRLFEYIQLRYNGFLERVYEPGRYYGRVNLFLAAETPEKDLERDLKIWNKLIAGRIEKDFVPGDHFALLQRPHVQVLAEKIRAHLESPR